MFPDEVKLCTSSVPGAGLGVCASRPIPLGTWIGPYEGQVVRRDELTEDTDTKYMWEVGTAGAFPLWAQFHKLEKRQDSSFTSPN